MSYNYEGYTIEEEKYIAEQVRNELGEGPYYKSVYANEFTSLEILKEEYPKDAEYSLEVCIDEEYTEVETLDVWEGWKIWKTYLTN